MVTFPPPLLSWHHVYARHRDFALSVWTKERNLGKKLWNTVRMIFCSHQGYIWPHGHCQKHILTSPKGINLKGNVPSCKRDRQIWKKIPMWKNPWLRRSDVPQHTHSFVCHKVWVEMHIPIPVLAPPAIPKYAWLELVRTCLQANLSIALCRSRVRSKHPTVIINHYLSKWLKPCFLLQHKHFVFYDIGGKATINDRLNYETDRKVFH